MLAQAAGAAERGAFPKGELLTAEAFMELQMFQGIIQRLSRMLEETVLSDHLIAACLNKKLLGLRLHPGNDDNNPALHQTLNQADKIGLPVVSMKGTLPIRSSTTRRSGSPSSFSSNFSRTWVAPKKSVPSTV